MASRSVRPRPAPKRRAGPAPIELGNFSVRHWTVTLIVLFLCVAALGVAVSIEASNGWARLARTAAVCAGIVVVRTILQRGGPAEIDLGERGLTIRSRRGAHRVPYARIARAKLAGPELVLEMASGNELRGTLRTARDGARILGVVARPPRGGRWSLPLEGVPRRARAFVGVVWAAVLFGGATIGLPNAFGAYGAAWTMVVAFAGFLAMMVSARAALAGIARPGSVEVGIDGLAVRSGRSRAFYPFASVSSAFESKSGVQVNLVDGSEVELPTTRPFDTLLSNPLGARRRAALLERIREAHRTHVQSARRRAPASIARDGQSIEAWRDGVRALLSEPDYRRASLGKQGLMDLLEQPAASPEARIGAALALSAEPDEATRKRIRIAVESSANEELREAMSSALEGELEELDEADVERFAPGRKRQA